MPSQDREYLRHAQIVVGKVGTGLLIENLRVTFEVIKDIHPAPNTVTVKIYNLTDDHQNQIRREYADLVINAGYVGSERMLFRGNIKHVYKYRDKNDFIVEVEGGDGDKDFRSAIINETLAAGTTDAQLVDRCVATFTGGTKKGVVSGVGRGGRLRGKVVSGNTRAVLDTIAAQNNCNWSIQDGQLHIIPVTDVLPSQAIVVNSATGMLGAPEQDEKGITVKTLLNPQYQVNGRIQLDNNDIRKKQQNLKSAPLPIPGAAVKAVKEKKTFPPARLDPDGIYKIIKVTHKGDTRGSDWYSEVVCIARGATVPQPEQEVIE